MWQPQRSCVAGFGGFLHPRNRPRSQELQQCPGVQRWPVGQPQHQRARDCALDCARDPGGGSPGRRPQHRGRDPEDLPDGLVELADRAEPGRERDLAEPEVGRLDQGTGGLRALRPSQRERPGTELGGEHPVQVPPGVPEPGSQPRYPVPVDHPVPDQPDRPADHVGPDVPLW
jgi:hypothetical protein